MTQVIAGDKNEAVMYVKNLILCLVCLSLLGACRNRKADNNAGNTIAADSVFVFDLENSIGAVRADTVMLNNIIEDTHFIALESSAETMVPNIMYTFVATEKHFVLSSLLSSHIVQFDSKGRFIREMVRRGRGPGELPVILLLSINKSLNTICAGGDYKFVTVSLDDGKWRDIIPEKLHALDAQLLNDGSIVFSKSASMGLQGVDIPYLTFIDSDGQVIRELSYGDTRDASEYSYTIPEGTAKLPYEGYYLSSIYDGNVLFQDVFNDTVSLIKSSEEIYPHLILKRGNYFPKAKDANDITEKIKHIYIRNIMETEKYVLLRYFYNDKLYSDIWDKATCGVVSRVETPSESWWLTQTFNVRYLLPDGSEVLLNVVYADKDKLYCLLEPSDARHFVPGIADDANPVVMIAELK
jgi:hypothetical protein